MQTDCVANIGATESQAERGRTGPEAAAMGTEPPALLGAYSTKAGLQPC